MGCHVQELVRDFKVVVNNEDSSNSKKWGFMESMNGHESVSSDVTMNNHLLRLTST